MKKIFDCEKRGIDIISRMSETTITCPSCGHTFSLSDVQKHELDHMRADMEKKIE
jgi:uncharacterized protein (DUF2225 family)